MLKSQKNKNNINLYCPSCENKAIAYIGRIPDANFFAGRVLKQSLAGGDLYRCNTCYLYFRWPRPSNEELNFLYRKGKADNWQYQPQNRGDWQIIASWLNSHQIKKTILDVGCADGGFLEYLRSDWNRYGIEINTTAAQKAKERGITIIAEDLDQLSQLSQKFSVVVAMDMIEHTKDPQRFLQEMLSVTMPGGVVIIATGNSLSPSWRFMKSAYWYCAIPEHVSFINKYWCQNVSQNLKCPILYFKKFSHADEDNFFQFLSDSLKNILYKFMPGIFSRLRTAGLGGIDIKRYPELKYYPPSWRSAKDHFIVIFQKSL